MPLNARTSNLISSVLYSRSTRSFSSKQSAGGRPQPRAKEGYSGETVAQMYFHSVSVLSAERGWVGGVKIKVRTK